MKAGHPSDDLKSNPIILAKSCTVHAAMQAISTPKAALAFGLLPDDPVDRRSANLERDVWKLANRDCANRAHDIGLAQCH
jgi:hypothetical protein